MSRLLAWLPRLGAFGATTSSPFDGRPVDDVDFNGHVLVIQWGGWQLSLELTRAARRARRDGK